MKFKLIKNVKYKNYNVRLGQIEFNSGIKVNTPMFMPVGTKGSVKSLSFDDLLKIGYELILSNTYHMFIRPGTELISQFGGLHKFYNWNGSILTDSGGFQVMSLNNLNKITDEGVEFKSHIDGKKIFLTPENVVEIQNIFQSDIQMILDQCVHYNTSHLETKEALIRSNNWATRARKVSTPFSQFGIIQGGFDKELRQQSLNHLLDLDFPGYAIGGLSVGESKKEMFDILSYTSPKLPEDKPRYLMGIGTTYDIIDYVLNGIDLSDCVLPTRNARHGNVFSRNNGLVRIKNSKYKNSKDPIDLNCSCYTCKNHSLAYLRHLYYVNEPVVYRLLTIHNLKFIYDLVSEIQNIILNIENDEEIITRILNLKNIYA